MESRIIDRWTDYTGIPVKEPPSHLSPETRAKWHKCQRCEGHGECNYLEHHGSYTKLMCLSCWGWGWKSPDDLCSHEWFVSRQIGRCLQEWKCDHCGATREVDSSD